MKTVEDYVQEIKAASDADWQRKGYNMSKTPTFGITRGSKYAKITITTYGQTSVHCFVDSEGNIYKAAGWKVPAKGIRGNINDDKKPLLGYQYYIRY